MTKRTRPFYFIFLRVAYFDACYYGCILFFIIFFVFRAEFGKLIWVSCSWFST